MNIVDLATIRYEHEVKPGDPTASRPIPCPSLKTLRSIPWLGKLHNDPEQVVRTVRRFMRHSALDPQNYRSAGYTIKAAEHVLDTLNKVLETYGVESVCRDAYSMSLSATRFLYLNTGDTYTTTILFYVPTRSWRVTTWGDVVEADERRGIKYR